MTTPETTPPVQIIDAGAKPTSSEAPEVPENWSADLQVPAPQPLQTQNPPKASRGVSERYQISTATVPGRAHLNYEDSQFGGNNQDSICTAMSPEYGIIVVCDGCSKTKNSEVGAKILTRLFTEAFQKHEHIGIVHQILAQVEAEVTIELKLIVDKLLLKDETREDVVRDYFLCSVLGAFISTAGVTFWGMGDGVYGFDSHLRVVEPAAGSTPAYFGYRLFKEWPQDIAQHGLQIYNQVMYHPDAILVGTAGVKDLIALSNDNFPGTHDPIGKIERLWREERYWKNPDELAAELRRLQLIRRAGSNAANEQSAQENVKEFLPDDTTLAILREIEEVQQKVEPQRSKGSFRRAPMSEVGRRTAGFAPTPEHKHERARSESATTPTETMPQNDHTVEKRATPFKPIQAAVVAASKWVRGLFVRVSKEGVNAEKIDASEQAKSA